MMEILCSKCDHEFRVGQSEKGCFEAMRSIHFLKLVCCQCDTVTDNYHICDLLIVKLTKLTTRLGPLTDQSEHELMVKIDELKDLISQLRPMVADTSFALGILYRELADIYETLKRMDKCVEAYKMMFPIVE